MTMRGDLFLTHLVLTLPPASFASLLKLITDPDPGLQSGGYQNRKRKWRDQINEATHSIELDPDDVSFIRRQIINRHGGGWQAKVAAIFANQHERFSRLPVIKRRGN